MKIIRSTPEDDMIATFLRGEYSSARFGEQVRTALQQLHADERMITNPDLSDREANRLRRQLLREARGYGSNESWFTDWPQTVEWYRAELTQEELANVRYIVYSYWIDLTGGTLRAGDAAQTIESGKEIFGVSNEPFLKLSQAVIEGQAFPPMIFVGTSNHDLVVLEGHARLTGYVLAGKHAPASLEVIIGLSPEFANWKMYSYEAYDRHRNNAV